MSKYVRLIYNSMAETLTYRANLVISFAVIAIPFIIAVIFWKGVFFANNSVADYSLKDIITYYFLVLFTQDFTYPVLNYDIVMDIKNGRLNFLLIKPVNYFWYTFFLRLGSNIVYLSVVTAFLIIYVLIFAKFLILNLNNIPAFLLSFLFSYILGALISFFFSIFTLFLENFAGLESFVNFIVPVFSGILLPISMLPGLLYKISLYLPLKLLVFYPVEIYLGKKDLNEGIIYSYLFWILFFAIINLFVWREGLKKYRAVGG